MFKTIVFVGINLSVVATLVAGCSGAGAPGSSTTGETDGVAFVEETSPLGSIQRTIVSIQADGSTKVATSTITQAEQDAERALRVQLQSMSPEARSDYVLTVDPKCADADIWLFNLDPVGVCPAEICFYNYGSSQAVASLASYENPAALESRPGSGSYVCVTNSISTWSGNVGRYWSGTQDACLASGDTQEFNVGNYDYINIAQSGAETTVPSSEVGWTKYLWLSASTVSGDTSGYCGTEVD